MSETFANINNYSTLKPQIQRFSCENWSPYAPSMSQDFNSMARFGDDLRHDIKANYNSNTLQFCKQAVIKQPLHISSSNGSNVCNRVDSDCNIISKRDVNNILANEVPNYWSRQLPRCQQTEIELFSKPNFDIDFTCYNDIPIKVTGSEIPSPASNFVKLNLHPWLMDNVKLSGYSELTQVQKYAIPSLLANRDVMACAQTGCGKTAAFLLPIINNILQNKPKEYIQTKYMHRRRHPPSALVIAPTRELTLQIYNEARKFVYRTPIQCAILYGGSENGREQINKVRLGSHVLIATPGRLIDVVDNGFLSLDCIQYLILDEADRLLDMGFEPQIRHIVEMSHMPPKEERVTAMFSSTFPHAIQLLACDFMRNDYILLGGDRVDSASGNVLQKIVWVEDYEKTSYLIDLLEAANAKESLTLIFAETKRGCNELGNFLYCHRFNVVTIHGDFKQFERENSLLRFRSGKANILVATAIAARGLDIPNVKHVINYDLPGDIDEYIHRIGRTGRMGNVGFATSFFNHKNRNIAISLSKLLIENNQNLPIWLKSYGLWKPTLQ